MRLKHIFSGLCLTSSLVCSFAETSEQSTESTSAIHAVALFPESNPFGHVVNGEKNTVSLTVEKKSDRNVTLTSIGGSFLHPDTNAVIKNASTTKLTLPFNAEGNIVLPYAFYSEFKPGDLRLKIWVDYTVDGEKYRAIAYDSIVTIVETENFDLKMLITYLIVAGIVAGLSYFTYLSFFPPPKRQRTKKPVPSPTDSKVTTESGSMYQEEWIPVHHLKGKSGKSATSGDELSGGEASGVERRKKKGKK